MLHWPSLFDQDGWIKYRVARNFCESFFFFRIGVFFFVVVLRELIFAIRTDWFFLLGINFCDFQKVTSTQHWQYFRFDWVRAIEMHIFKQFNSVCQHFIVYRCFWVKETSCTVNSLLMDTSIRRTPLKNGHLELVSAFLCSPYLTLYKTDFFLRQTHSTGPKGVRLRESWL